MNRYIAFLRAINVGGHTVKMDALARLFRELGLTGVETFIASGNVIFQTEESRPAALERRIEGGLHAALGYPVSTFLRTPAQVAAIARCQPFPEQAHAHAGAFVVGFVGAPLDTAARKKVLALATDVDSFHVKGSEVYWLCALRQSDSKFSNAAFERALGIPATFRGMNTIQRLTAKYPH